MYHFVVSMTVRPLELSLTSSKRILSAGTRSELGCKSYGSRPPARISWFKGTVPITGIKEGSSSGHHPESIGSGSNQQHVVIRETLSSDGNISISTLSFIPSPKDNGQAVSCRASNPLMGSDGQQTSLEEMMILQVHCEDLSLPKQTIPTIDSSR